MATWIETMKRSWVLTEMQKQELVRRYKAGERVSDIAAHFGVTKNSVSRAAIQRGLRRRPRGLRRHPRIKPETTT